jgi:hypothetical protein
MHEDDRPDDGGGGEAGTCSVCGLSIPAGARYWAVTVNEEVFAQGAVDVRDSQLAWQFCERCAATLDLEELPMPRHVPRHQTKVDAIDELAQELADAYEEVLGEPDAVLRSDDGAEPHVDVYLYAPGRLLEGWALVTAGRSLEPVAGARIELVQHLRPSCEKADLEEPAEVLRRVALTCDREDSRWTFRPLSAEPFEVLRALLRFTPLFVLAVFRRPEPAA